MLTTAVRRTPDGDFQRLNIYIGRVKSIASEARGNRFDVATIHKKLCSGQITATAIGEFNDLFDGAIHRYGTEKERTDAAEKEWGEMESIIGANETIARTLQ